MHKSLFVLALLSATLLTSDVFASGLPPFVIGHWVGQATHASGDPLLDHGINLDIGQSSATSFYDYPGVAWQCTGDLDYLGSFNAGGATVHEFYESATSPGCIDGYVRLIDDTGAKTEGYEWRNPIDPSDTSTGRVLKILTSP